MDDEPVTRDIGNYTVTFDPPLGYGTFGMVNKAIHNVTKTIFAAKQLRLDDGASLNKHLYDMAQRELRIIERIHNHENIVKLHDHFMRKGVFWIVLEFCDLKHLKAYLKNNKHLDMSARVKIMYQASSGVAFMHRQNPPVVHRDIKLENIMMKREGSEDVVKITDFGLSKLCDERHSLSVAFQRGQYMSSICGSKFFMAPELQVDYTDEIKYDSSVDTFALGLVCLVVIDKEPNEDYIPLSVKASAGYRQSGKYISVGEEMMECQRRKCSFPIVVNVIDGDSLTLRRVKRIILQMTKFNPTHRKDIEEVEAEMAEIGEYLSAVKVSENSINAMRMEVQTLKTNNVGLRKTLQDADKERKNILDESKHYQLINKEKIKEEEKLRKKLHNATEQIHFFKEALDKRHKIDHLLNVQNQQELESISKMTFDDVVLGEIQGTKLHLQKLAERTEEVLTLPLLKLAFLDWSGDLTIVNTMYKELEIKIDNTDVIFIGNRDDVQRAKLRVLEVANQLHSQKLDVRHEGMQRLLGYENARQALMDSLQPRLRIFIFMDNKNRCFLCCKSDESLKAAAEEIHMQLIGDRDIPIEENIKPLLVEQSFDTLVQQLEAAASYEVVIQIVKTSIRITGLPNRMGQVIDRITCFLNENAIVDDFVSAHPGIVKLLSLHPGVSNDIEEKCKVENELVNETDISGVLIKGPIAFIPQAKQMFMDSFKKVEREKFRVTAPGMSQYFLESDGQDQIGSFETQYKVSILPLDDKEQLIISNVKQSDLTTTMHGVTIAVRKGAAETFPCDALLVCVQDDFLHPAGVSHSLLRKAGKKALQDIEHQKASSIRLMPGTAFATTAGDLNCKHIIHCVEPRWQGGGTTEDTFFYEAFYAGMMETYTKGHTSVNIPVNPSSSMPTMLQMQKIVEAVRDYTEKYRSLAPKKITLIVQNDRDIAATFEPVFCNAFNIKDPKRSDAESRARRANSASPATAHTGQSQVLAQSVPHAPRVLQPAEHNKMRLQNGTILSVVRGELAKSKLEVLVNTTSQAMTLSNVAVSASLLREGGFQLQKECTQRLRDLRIDHADFGEIIPSSGGRLACKTIYHAALDSYSTSNNTPTKVLEGLVLNSLRMASEEKRASLAFPALGTGNLNFPKEFVANRMLRKIIEFGNLYPSSSLRTIEIVVIPEDHPTVQAFESALGKVKRNEDEKDYLTQEPVQMPTVHTAPTKTIKSPVRPKTPRSSQTVQNISLKKISLDIIKGDITEQSTDAIVYAIDKSFSFGGLIGRMIKDKAGPEILEEVKKENMSSGVAITKAGKLKCKYIIHIDAPNSTKDWKSRITKSLKLADSKKISSISFPALGTGVGNVNPGEMATKMAEGIEEFSGSVKYLKQINIVIYESKMLARFQEEFTRIAAQRTSKGWMATLATAAVAIGGAIGLLDTGDDGNLQEHHESPVDDGWEEVELIQDVKNISLQIHAYKTQSLTETIERIKRECTQMSRIHKLDREQDSEDISKLSDKHVRFIKNLQYEHHVDITINKGSGPRFNSIAIRGLLENVTKVLNEVHRLFSEAGKENDKKALHSKVKWQYQTESDGDDDAGMEIDFRNMIERQRGVAGALKKIRRYAPDSVELPKEWSKMKDGVNLKKVILTENDPNTRGEYELIFTQFKRAIEEESERLNVTLKEVVQIQRIQNPRQYRRYIMHMNHMHKPGQMDLWHGTSEDTIPKINASGFNRSYAGKNATVYGKGVYFSKFAGYSNRYAVPDSTGVRSVYLCRVLTGEFAQGSGELIDTPLKDASNPLSKYDSVVDVIADPTMWIVFTDTQAYPDYLIKYKV